jgi:hypothetical protein
MPLRIDPARPGKDMAGKLFRVEAAGVCRCMVCDALFHFEEARKHSTVPCSPVRSFTGSRASAIEMKVISLVTSEVTPRPCCERSTLVL